MPIWGVLNVSIRKSGSVDAEAVRDRRGRLRTGGHYEHSLQLSLPATPSCLRGT
jgi:hypothetical protein